MVSEQSTIISRIQQLLNGGKAISFPTNFDGRQFEMAYDTSPQNVAIDTVQQLRLSQFPNKRIPGEGINRRFVP